MGALKSVILDANDVQGAPWLQDLDWEVPVTVADLPCGDIWASTKNATLIIERKTISDLLGSIKDGRLFNQGRLMAQASDWCYVMVTNMPLVGSGYIMTGGQMTGWRWSSVQGALLTLDDIGVPTVWVPEAKAIHLQVHWLAGRKRDDIRVEPREPRRRPLMQPAGEQLLAAIDGIGPTKAESLIEYCGSAALAFELLTEEDWPDPDGLGAIRPSDRAAVRRALGVGEKQIKVLRVRPGDTVVVLSGEDE